MIERLLPDFCYSWRELEEVSGVVNHFFSAVRVDPYLAFDVDACYDLFLDLNSPGKSRGRILPVSKEKRTYASAHFMIARDGKIYQLVPEHHQAYHAGMSHWDGRDYLNRWTIGIEYIGAHPDDIKRYGLDPELAKFTDDQYAAGSMLIAQLKTKYGFPLSNVVGHDQVAPERKVDPGPMFDWDRLLEPLRSVG